MEIGKLPNSTLEKLILNSLETRRSETVLRPAVGEDCCALNLGNNLCVISSDPITAADENAGILAVLVSLNDLASCGAEPVGILTTVLLPPNVTENTIRNLFNSINSTCVKMNIDVLGGHTEVTESVKKIIIITTAIGKVPAAGLVKSNGANPGDAILMTKAAGLEGTAIIASDKREVVKSFLTEAEVFLADECINEISVLDEGLTAASNGATSMHDITEGGLLGALWEICKASGCGAEINAAAVKIKPVTQKICDHFCINPLKLISSGSMLITCSQTDKIIITEAIFNKGIDCAEIGTISENMGIVLTTGTEKTIVNQPEADELYKVL